MVKNKDGVIFPVAPNLSEMCDDYLKFIEEVTGDRTKKNTQENIMATNILEYDIG